MSSYALNLTRADLEIICNKNPRAIKAFEALLAQSKILATSTGFTAEAVTSSPFAPYFVGGAHYYFCDTTAANIILILPTAIGNQGLASIKKIAAANTVTVQCTGAETIDGAPTATILVKDASITVVSDGAGWRII